MKIDFVSDIVCPWCAVGLNSLEIALERLRGEVQTELHFQPFELNPQMGVEGEDIEQHLQRKYGLTPEQSAANREALRQRGEAVGFPFRLDRRSRTWNSFDAHRLLHWAHEQGPQQQHALKRRLLQAYFTDGANVSDRAVLEQCAADAGLDREEAARVLQEDRHADDVRERERFYLDAGISGVPAVIVNERYLISGGQPPEVFEEALRRIAGNAEGNVAD